MTRRSAKRSKASDLEFTDINTRDEYVVLRNNSSKDFDISGCVVEDLVGHHKCKPFENAVVPAKSSITIWTAPGNFGPENLKEDESNLFWRNISNGLPRNRPVLNNDGDGLKLVDASGNVLAEVNSADFEGEAAVAETPSLISPRRVTSKTVTSSASSRKRKAGRTSTTVTSTFSRSGSATIMADIPDHEPAVRSFWSRFTAKLDMIEQDALEQFFAATAGFDDRA
eukprot:m.16621 g.16621  ORF g.16621 m.16621 type:complete len:226 (+) comp10592_c0_seq1:106-783(+)